MFAKIIRKLFGSRNDRLIKQYRNEVVRINQLEAQLSQLSDPELQHKTHEFRERYAKGETLDALLPEAFAVVREAGKRVLGMRHYDVQLIGGMVLHYGKIAEMRTGEGKTLVATLPAYLNSLSGKGVHVVTVNDYLAQRDAKIMRPLYEFLGLTVGVNLASLSSVEKRDAYAADITYGTNNEFGFDYLRDNMVYHPVERVQRALNYGIIDEVDSILIDEARTPLIISGPAEDNVDIYLKVNELVPYLTKQDYPEGKEGTEDLPKGDYTIDEKAHSVLLTEQGHVRAEELLSKSGLLPEGSSLYDPANINLMHHLYAALRAHALYHLDQHYVIQDGEVVIVDEFTGRLMSGRRWSDGLHQAVEAKEGVEIQQENQTLASITFQNYFRMYQKLSGMTGTADTEAFEFQEIYRLETVIIPTHRDMIRKDMMDQVFRTHKEKFQAVINDIKNCYERGQPVLVGTTSIESSELLSSLLKKEKLKHQVLNAKQHAHEAEIIAQAGRPHAITIATNMAGRGTDIVLGGNIESQIDAVRQDADLSDEDKQKQIEKLKADWQDVHEKVIQLGGLHIIGTERHESRRIDNQLRGRSGRQGDPGSSRFYLSLEDPLLRIFASDRVANIMDKLNMPEGEAIEHPWVTRAIENAQRKVEARNFDIRKQLLEYDDVSNEQRKAIYAQRNELLESKEIAETIAAMRQSVFNDIFDQYIPPESLVEEWDLIGFENLLLSEFKIDHADFDLEVWLEEDKKLDRDGLKAKTMAYLDNFYLERLDEFQEESFHNFERSIMLQTLDKYWREHLSALDHLRQGIHLRGYAQKNPKQEYKREAFELFADMLERIKREVVQIIMSVEIEDEEEMEEFEEELEQKLDFSKLNMMHASSTSSLSSDTDEKAEGDAEPKQRPTRNALPKVGRNEPCPCGSGKKYKQCHGQLK